MLILIQYYVQGEQASEEKSQVAVEAAAAMVEEKEDLERFSKTLTEPASSTISELDDLGT